MFVVENIGIMLFMMELLFGGRFWLIAGCQKANFHLVARLRRLRHPRSCMDAHSVGGFPRLLERGADDFRWDLGGTFYFPCMIWSSGKFIGDCA